MVAAVAEVPSFGDLYRKYFDPAPEEVPGADAPDVSEESQDGYQKLLFQEILRTLFDLQAKVEKEHEENRRAKKEDLEDGSQEAPILPPDRSMYGASSAQVLRQVISACRDVTVPNIPHSRHDEYEEPLSKGAFQAFPPGLPNDGCSSQPHSREVSPNEWLMDPIGMFSHDEKASLWAAVSGTWKGHQGESYEILLVNGAPNLTFTTRDGDEKTVELIFEQPVMRYWWGEKHFMELNDLLVRPHQIFWYDAEEMTKRRPSLVWKRPHLQPNKILSNSTAVQNEFRQTWMDAIPALSQRAKSRLSLYTGQDASESDDVSSKLENDQDATDDNGGEKACHRKDSKEKFDYGKSPSDIYQDKVVGSSRGHHWDEYSNSCGQHWDDYDDKLEEVHHCLEGSWEGHKNESYEITARDDSSWTCKRTNAKGSKNFKITWDGASWVVWWGNHFWLDAEELIASRYYATWYSSNAHGVCRTCFKWTRPMAPQGPPAKNGRRKKMRAHDEQGTVLD